MSQHESEVQQFWEHWYGEQPQIWSGHANQSMIDVVTALPPQTGPRGAAPRALDLGCGEGADALWLAEQGWQVTAADVSATALARGGQEARARGLTERISWQRVDLSADFPDGSYELVSACFLASPVALPRTEVLAKAVRAVTPGGVLVLVSHAAPPVRAGHDQQHQVHDHQDDERRNHDQHNHDQSGPPMPTPAEELASLALDPQQWRVLVAEVKQRPVGSGNDEATIHSDTVVVARRTT